MLAILAALTEVIKANGGKESSTEYFAALVRENELKYHKLKIWVKICLIIFFFRSLPYKQH